MDSDFVVLSVLNKIQQAAAGNPLAAQKSIFNDNFNHQTLRQSAFPLADYLCFDVGLNNRHRIQNNPARWVRSGLKDAHDGFKNYQHDGNACTMSSLR